MLSLLVSDKEKNYDLIKTKVTKLLVESTNEVIANDVSVGVW